MRYDSSDLARKCFASIRINGDIIDPSRIPCLSFICLFKLSDLVNDIIHIWHWYLSGKCDFICFFMLATLLPHSLQLSVLSCVSNLLWVSYLMSLSFLFVPVVPGMQLFPYWKFFSFFIFIFFFIYLYIKYCFSSLLILNMSHTPNRESTIIILLLVSKDRFKKKNTKRCLNLQHSVEEKLKYNVYNSSHIYKCIYVQRK